MTGNARPSVQPIQADDAALERALADAQLPCLLAALVHLTGNLQPLRELPPLAFGIFGGEQGGMSPEAQARARALALEVLRAYRDAGSPAPTPLGDATVREIMSFLAGGQIP